MWSFFFFFLERKREIKQETNLINYKKSPNKSIQTDIFTTPKNFLAERGVYGEVRWDLREKGLIVICCMEERII